MKVRGKDVAVGTLIVTLTTSLAKLIQTSWLSKLKKGAGEMTQN